MKARWRRFACRFASMFHPPENGPVICAAMVRNEIDLIDVWISHLHTLFDRVILYDHQSTDGTRERLHELANCLPGLEVRNFDEPGHAQARLMSETLREVAAQHDHGWLFLLDADEFVMTSSRAELRAVLERYRAATTVRLTWCNALPVDLMDTPGVALSADTPVTGWHAGPIVVPKVAVNLRYADTVSDVRQGNHAVNTKRRRPFRKVNALRLLHLPIRSRRQIRAKVMNGIAANALVETDGKWAAHWKAIAASAGTEDPRNMVFNYGLQDPDKDRTTNKAPPAETISGPLSSLVPMSG